MEAEKVEDGAGAIPPAITIGVRITMTDAEHRHLLFHVGRMVELDPAADSPFGVALQILAFVLEEWEKERWPLVERWPFPAGENMVG